MRNAHSHEIPFSHSNFIICVTMAPVEADPGNMGGYRSHEYHVLSDSGQDTILICPNCSFAMNQELVHQNKRCSPEEKEQEFSSLSSADDHDDGDMKSDEVMSHKNVDRHAKKQGGGEGLPDSTDPGEIDSNILDDRKKKPLKCPKCQKLRSASSGSDEPNHHRMEAKKGIELGHSFLLGTRYSKPFQAYFNRSVNGKTSKELLWMGCYGIGVTRLLAASLESLTSLALNQRMMRWPRLVVPFDIAVIPPKKGSYEETALGPEFMEQMAGTLSHKYPNLDIVIDDRSDLTIGRRIKDHLARGVPFLLGAGKDVREDIPLFEIISAYDDEQLLNTKNGDKFNYKRIRMNHLQVMDYFNTISQDLASRWWWWLLSNSCILMILMKEMNKKGSSHHFLLECLSACCIL